MLWSTIGSFLDHPPGLQFQVTGLPPNTQVHWPDEQDFGCNCGFVSTVTTTNDAWNPYEGPGENTQFEILPNVGGTTPTGTYTLVLTVRPGGGAAYTYNWTLNISAPSFPSGLTFLATSDSRSVYLGKQCDDLRV